MEKISSIQKAKQAFLDLYDQGLFKPGERIPSELTMAQRFGVSRETWRSALNLLKRDGIVISRHGSGTYLLERTGKISVDLAQLQSMQAMIRAAGIQEKEFRFSCSWDKADSTICSFFEVQEDELFCIMRRIRYSPDCAICSSLNYLPAKMVEELTPDIAPASVLQYLEDEKKLKVSRAMSQIVVPVADDPLRLDLDLPEGVQALGLLQRHYDARGLPILYSIDYFRCDQFNFTISRIPF